jgi:GT2 family glycosyltransferase
VPEHAFDDLLELYRWRFSVEDPLLLDWTGAMRVRPRITDPPVRDERPNAPARNTVVFGPAGDGLGHPDRSVHLVVLDGAASEARRAEARRVARDGIVSWSRAGGVAADWLRGPEPARPVVSVLVVTADAPRLLDDCLRSIAATTPVTGAIEIVVADASVTEASAGVAAAWSGRLPLRHVRADPTRGPIGAVNPGSEAARGEILVVVGQGTRVVAGWLRPLVRTLVDDPGVGVVGPKLLAADGTLAAAGGAIFSDGSVTGFGAGSRDPDAPAVGYVRDVPWASGALLATRRGLLRRLGGIDPLAGEGYGDVDYCLRVHAAGRRVVYQPESVSVCQPPVDAGPPDGRPAWFHRRWTNRLAASPDRPARLDAAAWDRLAWIA